MEIPTYHKLLFFSDAAVIPRPTLQQRIEMIWYAICTCRHFGIEQPRVALIHCTEKVSAKFPHSLDLKEVGVNRECNTYKDSDEYDYALRRLKFFGIRFQKLR